MAAGLPHAFLNANNIVNYASGTARTLTPNISVAGATVNGSVPAVELNTLGDIMQSCVNGVTGNASCVSLFGFTPSISGVAPENTLQAFINRQDPQSSRLFPNASPTWCSKAHLGVSSCCIASKSDTET